MVIRYCVLYVLKIKRYSYLHLYDVQEMRRHRLNLGVQQSRFWSSEYQLRCIRKLLAGLMQYLRILCFLAKSKNKYYINRISPLYLENGRVVALIIINDLLDKRFRINIIISSIQRMIQFITDLRGVFEYEMRQTENLV